MTTRLRLPVDSAGRAGGAAVDHAAAAAAAAAARSSSASSASPSRSSGSSSRVVSAPRWTGGGGWSASKGQRVADLAMQWLGTPYSWGGGNFSGPTWGTGGPVGFDCSGLALWAWAQVGVYLPHYSGYQYSGQPKVSRSNLQPGDLVFFAYNTSDPSTIHHVAIWLGNDQIIEAPNSGSYVKISNMYWNGFIGAARPGG